MAVKPAAQQTNREVYKIRKEQDSEYAVNQGRLRSENMWSRFNTMNQKGSDQQRSRHISRNAKCKERYKTAANNGTICSLRASDTIQNTLAKLLGCF